MIKFIHATLLLASAISTYASPLHARSDEQPVLEKDFPDPALIQAGNGTWWSFATAGGGYNIQMASAPLPSGPWTYHEADALPQVGAWSTGSSVWAPDVRKIDSQYVMYYAAEQNGNGGSHCVAVATALDISGPYTAEAEPLSCNTSQGGSIDPSGFTDDDGSHWVTWKIDGNSIGNGGTCGNTVAPIVSTPIMLQRMSSSGITADGSEAIEILDRSQYDGPLIEAPVIIKVDGIYYLSFSSNCYSTPQYGRCHVPSCMHEYVLI